MGFPDRFKPRMSWLHTCVSECKDHNLQSVRDLAVLFYKLNGILSSTYY